MNDSEQPSDAHRSLRRKLLTFTPLVLSLSLADIVLLVFKMPESKDIWLIVSLLTKMLLFACYTFLPFVLLFFTTTKKS